MVVLRKEEGGLVRPAQQVHGVANEGIGRQGEGSLLANVAYARLCGITTADTAVGAWFSSGKDRSAVGDMGFSLVKACALR